MKVPRLAPTSPQGAATPADRGAAHPLHASPRQVAQRARIAAAFGPAVQRREMPGPQGMAPVQARPAPRRGGLPDGLRDGIESLSGMDMSGVRVHRNSAQPAQLNALAYAQGSDIHLGPGQEQHLPHEAWHVVQQAQGRVPATRQLKEGVPINDDAGLETEADVMGARAAAGVAQREVGGNRQDPTPAPVVQAPMPATVMTAQRQIH
jgi:hypothetical protein